VRRSGFVRRAALATMVLVTAWSVWAWAQPKHPAGAPAVAEKAAEAPEAEEAGPRAINWTEFGGETPPFIAMVINFAILAGAYYALGKKPIAEGLKSRRDTIARDIEEAQRMRAEADARAKSYLAKLEHLEEEMRVARDSLVHAGEAEHERIVKEAEAKAERMRKDAEFLVEQELKQIRGDLWREAVETAVRSAEELLKVRVTSADQERLAEDYLSDLGKFKAPATSNRPPA
jgi:F-type H+-transporting ATPase subunit b